MTAVGERPTPPVATPQFEVLAERQERRRGSLLALPAFLYLLIFFVVPFAIVVVYSFATRTAQGSVELGGWNLDSYSRLSEQIVRDVLTRSLTLALITTLVCLLIAYPFAFHMTTVGPMARRIRDVALALDVVVGPDPNDLRSLPHPGVSFRSACDDPRPPARVLWCPSIEGSELDAEVLAVTTEAVDRIRSAGVEVVEAAPIVPEVFSAFLLLFYGGMVPGYRDVIDGAAFAGVTPRLQEILTMADGLLSPESIEEARKTAQRSSIALAEAMEGFDCLLSPTTVGQTPRSERGGLVNGQESDGWVGNTYPLNVTRRPAGTTNAGFAADGMPVGLQIVGHQLDDIRAVELTAWVEDLLGFDPVAPFGP